MGHDAFKRDDLGGGHVQLMFGVARILNHEPLQKIDIALEAPRSLVQARGFRAVPIPAISCANPASTPRTTKLKANTAILIILFFHPDFRAIVTERAERDAFESRRRLFSPQGAF